MGNRLSRVCTEYKVTFVGRGQCLRSKLATERSGVCLHPAVTLFALSFGFAQTNGLPPKFCRDRRPRLSTVEKVTFVSKRTVRQLVARTPCPYNKWGDLVRRHCVFFSPFIFKRAIAYLRSKCAMKRSEILNRPQRCSHLPKAFPSGGRWQPQADG